MSKKQLLTEGEIRRFMKFAKLEPLAESFISEAGYSMHEGGDLYEGDYMHEEEEAEMPEGEGDMDDMDDMDDMGVEAEPEMGDEEAPAPAGDAEAVVADALQKLAAELKEKLGVDIGIETGGEDMEDMGDDAGEEMDIEEPPADEAGGEEMVAEVTRRVMARITESRRREQRANAIDEVTNRIMKRILRSK